MKEFREFSSYNGLDRTALFMGIPLLHAVGLLVLGIMAMFVGLYFFSLVGFLFVLIVVPFAFMLRTITMNDDKALQILVLEMKFRGKRVAYDLMGNTLTFVPERYLRRKEVYEQSFVDYHTAKK
ncbi:VirB3 family type IV secretion system protein [Moraxella porci]|uniref:VirB3 family type IV secretion system protein n=1 Tax=Moraxella porci TaxID=1288392 RepID=UPI0024479CC4|nr:VirB3 family type IV secretion system protein [Moraxella porci]MDH2274236.1 VirB3 family type IV secretion system protein [Moraxella porci]